MAATRRPPADDDRRFFELFDTVPVWMELSALGDGRYLEVNRAFTRVTGYDPDEVVGRSATDLGLWPNPEDRAPLLEKVKRVGRLEAHPCPLRMKGGEIRHFLLSCKTLHVGGEPCLLSTLVDVTDLHRAQGALARSEEKFATLFQTSPIWTLLATVKEGRYLEVNPAFTEMTGWTRDEVIGRTSREFGLWVDPAERDEILAVLETTGRLEARPCRFRVKSGEIRDFLWSAQVIDFEGVQCTLSGIQDITDLKQAEQLYRTLVDSSLSGIFIVKGTTLAYVNPRFVELRGSDQENLVGRAFIDLVHPDERDRVLEYARRRYAGEPAPDRYEVKALRADGSTAWTELRATRVELDGEPAILGNLIDITDRKSAEKQLRHSQKMEAVGTLAGGIAHEFNNLLQVITGAAQVMEDGGDPDRWLRRIRQAATRGGDLVKNLLQFSRDEEGERKPFDLNGCVTRAMEVITPTVPRMIEVVSDLADQAVVVDGVGPQWEQVVLNLAANACQAMAGGGRLTLSTRLDPAGRQAVLTVTDNGHGMDAGTVEHIYEPFFTTREVGEGAGLGLSIVYGVVQAHGGEIRCRSLLGEGTTFEITLPLAEEPAVVIGDADVASEAAPPDAPVRSPGGRILVADDEADIRELAQVQLHRAGYDPVVVDSGEAALEAYLAQRFDLVILDLGMPGMGGQKCLEALRGIDPNVKIVVASGYGPAQERDATAAGAAVFVRKPYRFKNLLKVVQEVLGG